MRKVLSALGVAIVVFTCSRFFIPRENEGMASTIKPKLATPAAPSHTSPVEASFRQAPIESGLAPKPLNRLLGPSLIPTNTLHNAGRNSAGAALETEICALAGGDVDLLASVIAFDPDEHEKLRLLLAATPQEIKNKYHTPERIVAFFLMGGQHMESLHVLTETPPRDNTAVELVEFKFFDDPTIRKDGVLCLKQLDGWKTVISGNILDRVTSVLNNPGTSR